jgi:hypothetical protein
MYCSCYSNTEVLHGATEIHSFVRSSPQIQHKTKKILESNPRARGKRGGEGGGGGGGRDAPLPPFAGERGSAAPECEAGQERASPSAVVAEGLGAALHVITVAGKAPRCADTPQTLERQRAGWRQKMSPRRCISPWIRCGMG